MNNCITCKFVLSHPPIGTTHFICAKCGMVELKNDCKDFEISKVASEQFGGVDFLKDMFGIKDEV